MASIAIVGGGVAGLGCAWRLRRAGFDVEVLEREGQPGGRMRSEKRDDGFTLDRGAQFVASGYRNLHGVAETLGIADRIRPLATPRNAILRGGRLHPADYDSVRALLETKLLSGRARLRLARLGLELVRRWPRLDPLRPERAALFDDEDLAAGLRRLVGDEATEYLFVPAFSSTFDSDPEDLSLAFALLAMRFVLGGFELQAFAGGNGLFTRALAREVPLRTGCEVLSVETETGGARVRYRSGDRESTVVADAVVVALPGTEVARVCPKLTPAERGFFEQVRYARGIVAYLLFERAPETLPGYGVAFPRRERFDLYGLAVDHHKPGAAPAGAGLVNAALTADAASRLWDASDAAVADLVLENLAATPIGPLRPFGFAVHRWAQMLPQFRAGYLRRLQAFATRLERSPRLAFAGDYLVGPYTEAALTSGMRAATEIARAL
jgi:oxygen-dependent protoporphyrinogen oxidase